MYRRTAPLAAILLAAVLSAVLALPAAATAGPSASAREESGEAQLRVHLAPALSHVGQQVVVHARFDPDGASGEDDHDDGHDDGHDDDPDDDGPDDDTGDDAPDDDEDAHDARAAGVREDDAVEGAGDPGDACADVRTGACDDDGGADDSCDEARTGACDEDEDGDDGACDQARTGACDDDQDEDDGACDQARTGACDDDDCSTRSVELDETSDDAPDDGGGEAPCADITFTVDFGDGTAEVMELTKRSGNDKRFAIARHRYAAEGTYQVTVTATPLDGEPVTTTVTATVGEGGARLEGADRIETAIRLSQDSFPEDGSADAVLLARADQFADALASASLAIVEQAPVLLTPSDAVPADVVEEIARALGEDGGTVYVLGGEAAVSSEVVDGLAALGFEVVRVAGVDRVGTALAIAEVVVAGGLQPTEVVLASAGGFADALAGAAHAAANGALVLLTDGADLDDRVAEFLSRLGTDVPVLVTGGEAVMAAAVVDELTASGFTVERAEGADRFATSVALAEARFDDADSVVLATGANYPDALAGAAHAGRRGAPVLLVGEDVPEAVRAYLRANAERIDQILVLGGEAAVPESVLDEATALIASPG